MAYIPSSGSVVAFQSDPTKLVATVSVVGIVNTAGSVAAVVTNTPTVNIGTSPGSVVAFQGTNPWIVTGSVQASLSPAANQSVSGAVQIAGASPASIATVQRLDQQVIGSNLGLVSHAVIHGLTSAGGGSYVDVKVDPSGAIVTAMSSVVAFQGGAPWTATFSNSSIYALQLAGSVLATSATVNTGNSSVQVLNFPTTQNVSGSVVGFQGTTPWIIGSIYGNISGSVAATITNTNVNVSGSVVGFQGTNPWVIGSIVGTYAEDSGMTDLDKGLFVLGVRNDTIASTVSADKDYTSFALDSAGRVITKPFVSDDATLIEYTGSVTSASVTLIKASAVGKKNYVTDFWLANTGSVATLVTFKDGSTSILAQTIVPAGGGSNSPGINIPFKSAPAQDLVFAAATTTSILYVAVRGYQAP